VRKRFETFPLPRSPTGRCCRLSIVYRGHERYDRAGCCRAQVPQRGPPATALMPPARPPPTRRRLGQRATCRSSECRTSSTRPAGFVATANNPPEQSLNGESRERRQIQTAPSAPKTPPRGLTEDYSFPGPRLHRRLTASPRHRRRDPQTHRLDRRVQSSSFRECPASPPLGGNAADRPLTRNVGGERSRMPSHSFAIGTGRPSSWTPRRPTVLRTIRRRDVHPRPRRPKAPNSWRTVLGESPFGSVKHNLFTDRRVAHLVKFASRSTRRLVRTKLVRTEMLERGPSGTSVKHLRTHTGPGPAFWGWGHLRRLRLNHPLFSAAPPLALAGPGVQPSARYRVLGMRNTINQAGARPNGPDRVPPHNMANLAAGRRPLGGPRRQAASSLCGRPVRQPLPRRTTTTSFPLWQSGDANPPPLPWDRDNDHSAKRSTRLRLLLPEKV